MTQKNKKLPVRRPQRSVGLTHSLDQAVAGLPELAQRLFIALAAAPVKDKVVELEIKKIVNMVGGNYTYYFTKGVLAAKKLTETSYTVEYDECRLVAEGAVIASSYRVENGKIRLVLSEQTCEAIANRRARYTLLFLEVIKRLNGPRIGAYIMLARWDNQGAVSYTSTQFFDETGARIARTQPTRFRVLVLEKLIAQLAKIGVVVKMSVAGRGKNTVYSFAWEPDAMKKASAALSPQDLGLPYSVSDELRVRATAAMSAAGCHDPHMPRRLGAMPAQFALDLVNEAIEQGYTKGALRNELVARLDRWERQQASETLRKQREATARESAATIEAEVVDQEKTVAAWLEEVDDEKLAESAMQLEDYNWEFLLPKFKKPATFEDMVDTLPILRKKAKADIVLGSLLAVAAGVIQE